MSHFLTAFVVFLLAHGLPTRPPIRRRLVAWLGERPFQLAYSLLSTILLVWLVVAAIEAPFVPLWAPASWHMHAAIALMPVAFVLAAIGLAVPNPLSINLYPVPDGWAPSGVLRFVRHPLLIGLALWSGLHAVANGDLVSLLLFGGLTLFAIAGIGLVNGRLRHEFGHAALKEIARRRTGYRDHRRQALAAAVGIAAMTVLLVLHPQLFGADPLAWL